MTEMVKSNNEKKNEESLVRKKTFETLKQVCGLYNVPYRNVRRRLKGIFYEPDSVTSYFNANDFTIHLTKDYEEHAAEECAHLVRRCYGDAYGTIDEFFGGLTRLILGASKKIDFNDEECELLKQKLKKDVETVENGLGNLRGYLEKNSNKLDKKPIEKEMLQSIEIDFVVERLTTINSLDSLENHHIGYKAAQYVYDSGKALKLLELFPDFVKMSPKLIEDALNKVIEAT